MTGHFRFQSKDEIPKIPWVWLAVRYTNKLSHLNKLYLFIGACIIGRLHNFEHGTMQTKFREFGARCVWITHGILYTKWVCSLHSNVVSFFCACSFDKNQPKNVGSERKSNNSHLIEIELLRSYFNPWNVVNVNRGWLKCKKPKTSVRQPTKKMLSIGDSAYHQCHDTAICVCVFNGPNNLLFEKNLVVVVAALLFSYNF